MLESDGRTYERRAIEEWLRRSNHDPLTSRTLASTRRRRIGTCGRRRPPSARRGAARTRTRRALRPEAAAPPAPPARPADGRRGVQAAAVGCALDAAAEQLLRDAEVDLDCVRDLEPEDVAEVGLTSHDAAALLAARPRLAAARPPRRGHACTLANSDTATCRAAAAAAGAGAGRGRLGLRASRCEPAARAGLRGVRGDAAAGWMMALMCLGCARRLFPDDMSINGTGPPPSSGRTPGGCARAGERLFTRNRICGAKKHMQIIDPIDASEGPRIRPGRELASCFAS